MNAFAREKRQKNQNCSFFIQHVVLWRVFRHELRHYDVTGRNNHSRASRH